MLKTLLKFINPDKKELHSYRNAFSKLEKMLTLEPYSEIILKFDPYDGFTLGFIEEDGSYSLIEDSETLLGCFMENDNNSD